MIHAGVFRTDGPHASPNDGVHAAAIGDLSNALLDHAELDEHLRQAEWLLARFHRVDRPAEPATRSPILAGHHLEEGKRRRRRRQPRANRRDGSIFQSAMGLVALGLTATSCGIALCAWSLIAARGELWNFGVPIAIAGQLALASGMFIAQPARSPDRGRPSRAPSAAGASALASKAG